MRRVEKAPGGDGGVSLVAHLWFVPELALAAEVHLEQPEVGCVGELVESLVKLMFVRGLNLLDVALRVPDLAPHRQRSPLREHGDRRG